MTPNPNNLVESLEKMPRHEMLDLSSRLQWLATCDESQHDIEHRPIWLREAVDILNRAGLTPPPPATEAECDCGLPLVRNPHPDAGKPDSLLEVGTVHVCIPCLVSNRHQWAVRAMTAENTLSRLRELAARYWKIMDHIGRGDDADEGWRLKEMKGIEEQVFTLLHPSNTSPAPAAPKEDAGTRRAKELLSSLTDLMRQTIRDRGTPNDYEGRGWDRAIRKAIGEVLRLFPGLTEKSEEVGK